MSARRRDELPQNAKKLDKAVIPVRRLERPLLSEPDLREWDLRTPERESLADYAQDGNSRRWPFAPSLGDVNRDAATAGDFW